jgi:hypothetical protein
MPVIYRLDSRDCLLAMNRRWSTFAKENGAPELVGDQLIGEPVWRYVEGVDVTRIYREVFWRVREQRIQVVFPFRCDSRDMRRDMLMKVLPKENNELEIQCLTKSVLRQSSPDTEDEPCPIDPATELLRMCSWCKSVNLEDRWIALEVAIKRLNLFGRTNVPQLTHTICPDCNDYLAKSGR